MVEVSSSFKPAWWLPGPHLQTLWGKFCRRTPQATTTVERLDTPDDDFLEIHHLDAPPNAPVLVLLHGLEGGIRSHYIQGLLSQAKKREWRAAVLVFRSCGAEMNRTPRSYHSGETTDLQFALEHLTRRFPSSSFLLAGASLGGNVLLKYLGEESSEIRHHIKAAVAVSVPFELGAASRHIGKGFARVYQHNFLRSLRRKARLKLDRFPDLIPAAHLERTSTLFDFDDVFTAPVHGFEGADDYYTRSSSLGWLSRIRVDTLLLSAVDDPFLPSKVLDDVRNAAAGNPHLQIEFPAAGGHVGFVSGRNPLRPRYYLELRVCDFLAERI
jgi:predicted alpha/beta-fold hydrolase